MAVAIQMKPDVVLTVRMDGGLRDELRALSQANNNSINREVVETLKKHVKRNKDKTRPKDLSAQEGEGK